MAEENFRNALSSTEKEILIAQLANEPGQVLQLDSPVGKIQFLIQKQDQQSLIVAPRSSVPPDLSGLLKLQFVYNRSRYESQILLESAKGGWFIIHFPQSIYKLQRRHNFRAPLPGDWICKIDLNQVNDNLCQYQGNIEDLSLTGCFFSMDNLTPLQVGDTIQGELSISDFKKIKFKAQVKRTVNFNNLAKFGIEFIDLIQSGSETLHAITLKAARKTRDYTED